MVGRIPHLAIKAEHIVIVAVLVVNVLISEVIV